MYTRAPCAWSTTDYQRIQGPLVPGPLPITKPHEPGPLPCPLSTTMPLVPDPLPITNVYKGPLCMVHSPITNVYKGPLCLVHYQLPSPMSLVHYHAPCPLPCPLCLVHYRLPVYTRAPCAWSATNYHAPCAWSTTIPPCAWSTTMPLVHGPLSDYQCIQGPLCAWSTTNYHAPCALPCPLCMVHYQLPMYTRAPCAWSTTIYHAPCAWSTTMPLVPSFTTDYQCRNIYYKCRILKYLKEHWQRPLGGNPLDRQQHLLPRITLSEDRLPCKKTWPLLLLSVLLPPLLLLLQLHLWLLWEREGAQQGRSWKRLSQQGRVRACCVGVAGMERGDGLGRCSC